MKSPAAEDDWWRSWDRPSATSLRRREPSSSRRCARCSSPGDTLLLGTDLVKDTGRLVRAYDDSAGVTAAFNRNVLAVVNRELHADFDLEAFDARREVERRRTTHRDVAARAYRANSVSRSPTSACPSTSPTGEEMLTEVSCKFTAGGRRGRTRAGRADPHPLVDRSGRGLRAVAGREVSRPDDDHAELARQWRAARPAVAGVHLDSAACSRQSNAAIDAAAHHARHEAEVGGYVAARPPSAVAGCRPRRDRPPWSACRPTTSCSPPAQSHALDLLLGSWPGPRTLACVPGEFGPNLAVMAANGFDVRALPVDGDGRVSGRPSRRGGPRDGSAGTGSPDRGGQPPWRGPTRRRGRRVVCGVWVCRWCSTPLRPSATSTARSVRTSSTPRRGSGWPGPAGVGFLAVRPAVAQRLRASAATRRSGIFPCRRCRVSACTRPISLPASAIRWHWASIWPPDRSGSVGDWRRSAAATRTMLDGVVGWRVVEPVDEPTAITTLVPPDGVHLQAVRNRLIDEHQIVTHGRRGGPGAVRTDRTGAADVPARGRHIGRRGTVGRRPAHTLSGRKV